jgi:hypothetical protein
VIRVNVTGKGDYDQALQELGRRAPAAIARAQNRAIAAGRTQLGRDVRADMKGVKASTIRERLIATNANKANPIARLRADARRVPLIEFGARGPYPSRGRGSVRAGGKRYQGAFIMEKRRGGGRGVFARTGGPRLPVVELHGPSIYQSAKNHLGPAKDRATEVFQTRLAHEIQHELRQVAKK